MPGTMDGTSPWWMRRGAHWLLLAALFFAAIAPTLRWLDFRDGMENFNVITAMEMTRDGHWLLPTLNGAPRLQKPPLTQWITAWGISTSDSLEWGARWPSLVLACIMLLAVYELGRVAGDWRLGLTAALACGTTVFFLRFARRASYDMQLATWVTVANVFLAKLVLERKWWLGCAGAGLALGLALMTKGPPALAQTVVPVVVFAGAAWCVAWKTGGRPSPLPSPGVPGEGEAAGGLTDAGTRSTTPSTGTIHRSSAAKTQSRIPSRVAPIALGVVLMLAVALPWVLYVSHAKGGLWRLWVSEVSMAEEQQAGVRNNPLEVLVMLPLCMPWLPWLFVGLGAMLARRREARVARPLALMTVLLFVAHGHHQPGPSDPRSVSVADDRAGGRSHGRGHAGTPAVLGSLEAGRYPACRRPLDHHGRDRVGPAGGGTVGAANGGSTPMVSPLPGHSRGVCLVLRSSRQVCICTGTGAADSSRPASCSCS